MMHVLEYLIYHLRPYGKDSKLWFTGELVNATGNQSSKIDTAPSQFKTASGDEGKH